MALSMREKILSATAKIIAAEGLDAVSIRYVCDKAGVKAPTLYYYFTDKEGLIEAVVDLAYQKYIKKQKEIATEESPLKGLVKSWDIFFELVDDEPELYHAIVIAHLRQKIPAAGLELFGFIEKLFQKLEEKKKLKYSHWTASQIFYTTAYGQALAYIAQGKNPALKSQINLARDLCMKSLLL